MAPARARQADRLPGPRRRAARLRPAGGRRHPGRGREPRWPDVVVLRHRRWRLRRPGRAAGRPGPPRPAAGARPGRGPARADHDRGRRRSRPGRGGRPPGPGPIRPGRRTAAPRRPILDLPAGALRRRGGDLVRRRGRHHRRARPGRPHRGARRRRRQRDRQLPGPRRPPPGPRGRRPHRRRPGGDRRRLGVRPGRLARPGQRPPRRAGQRRPRPRPGRTGRTPGGLRRVGPRLRHRRGARRAADLVALGRRRAAARRPLRSVGRGPALRAARAG